LALSQLTGINADEKFQDHYAERVLDYYLSGGADEAALYEDDSSSQRFNKYYGGFFELLSAGTNRLLGNEFGPAYYSVRHLLNALFAVLLLVVVARWTRQLAGIRAAVFALLLFLASPRLLGHGVMNPKDIPFAAGYVMAAYYLYRCLLTMPRLSWKDGLGFVLGGCASYQYTRGRYPGVFATRGLFLGLDFLIRYGLKGIWQQPKFFGRYAAYWIGSTLIAFILATLFWPYGLQDPIAHTLEALAQFSSYPIKITILFGGDNISSDVIPKAYPIIWIGLTVALSVLLGFLGSVVWGRSIGKRVGFLPLSILFFVALFPLVYIMVKDSALYDGWRQLLFVYPTTLVLGALFYDQLSRRLNGFSWGRYVLLGGLVLLSADALFFTLRNPGLAYVYFNPLAGGRPGSLWKL
jgi:4-amino-4-deoxy-L-arabinose transferase-like glycosyltransferase